jgi:hypothetical protein
MLPEDEVQEMQAEVAVQQWLPQLRSMASGPA